MNNTFDTVFDVRYYVHIIFWAKSSKIRTYMDTKTTISISEARKRIFDIAEAVQKPGSYFTLTEKGRPKAVMMSAEEFESWQETFEVMRDFPNLDEDIMAAKKDLAQGKTISLTDYLNEQGFVSKTLKKTDVIQNRNIKKSKKVSR